MSNQRYIVFLYVIIFSLSCLGQIDSYPKRFPACLDSSQGEIELPPNIFKELYHYDKGIYFYRAFSARLNRLDNPLTYLDIDSPFYNDLVGEPRLSRLKEILMSDGGPSQLMELQIRQSRKSHVERLGLSYAEDLGLIQNEHYGKTVFFPKSTSDTKVRLLAEVSLNPQKDPIILRRKHAKGWVANSEKNEGALFFKPRRETISWYLIEGHYPMINLSN